MSGLRPDVRGQLAGQSIESTALAAWRRLRERPADPMAACNASRREQKIDADPVDAIQAGWGA